MYHIGMEIRPNQSNPYKQLGNKLKAIRHTRKQTLAEVSGAIEIDIDVLKRFESGESRPSEELLLLFINHFSIPEAEAAKLWELANYDDNGDTTPGLGFDPSKQVALLMPMDARIVYTDLVHVMANDYGMVMNFMQTAGPGNQPLAVARVGMSYEHAESIVELLNKTLEKAKTSKSPKLLQNPQDVTEAQK